jgi:hypothetical protein
MDAKEAIAAAKAYVQTLFADDGAMNIGLEELRFDPDKALWLVTIGFTRTWEGPQGAARFDRSGKPWPRTFKTVEINDISGRILGLRHWPVAA